MMGLEVVCCGKCYALLQETHVELAEAWADMCAQYVLYGLKPIKWGYECDAIKFLEANRFVVTQEPEKGKRKLTLKPNGHRVISGQHFFCVTFEQHLENG